VGRVNGWRTSIPTGPETDERIRRLRAQGLLPPDGTVLSSYPSEPIQQPERAQPRPPASGGAVVLEPAEARPLPTVDLAELARKGIDPPELVCDRLLYRSCLHSLAGQPDGGKSTLAAWWTLGLAAQGLAVVVVDVEAGPEQVTEKLLALGADPDHLERLAYVHYPGARWDAADLAGLHDLAGRIRPALVLVDSIGVALAQAGKDENHVAEVEPLYSALLALARDHRAAVVLLDHVPKDGKGGRYARGSGAKLQLVDVALVVDVLQPFSRRQSGRLRLHVSKDRRGYLARDHDIRVEVEDGRMALNITALDPTAPGDTDSLPPAAVKTLAALRGRDEPQTIRELGDRMKRETGRALTGPTLRKQLNLLADHGLADSAGHPGKPKRWWATRTEEGGVPGVPSL
jgi:AAA domain